MPMAQTVFGKAKTETEEGDDVLKRPSFIKSTGGKKISTTSE